MRVAILLVILTYGQLVLVKVLSKDVSYLPGGGEPEGCEPSVPWDLW